MSEEQRTGITKIAVKGFKSIAEECEIDIRPLTILAGANSSGKSSIMQPLLLLKQTLEAPYDPGPLLIDGPNVRFTEAAQFLSTLPDKKGTDRFQIRIEIRASEISQSVATTFRRGQTQIELIEMTIEERVNTNQPLPPKYFTLYPEMTSEEIKSLAEQDLIHVALEVVRRSRCFLIFQTQGGFMSIGSYG